MLPRKLQAIISVILLSVFASATADTAAKISPKTTTSLLPLQAPVNLKSTTTSVFGTSTDFGSVENQSTVADRSDSSYKEKAKRENEFNGRFVIANEMKPPQPTSDPLEKVISSVGISDYIPATLNSETYSNNYSFLQPLHRRDPINEDASNSEGYIHFEVEGEARPVETEPSKAETVKEVLTNLFPKGFSDIFRFSYSAEPSTTTENAEVKPHPKQSVLIYELGTPSTPRGFRARDEVDTSLLQSTHFQTERKPHNKPSYQIKTKITPPKIHQEIELQNSELEKYPYKNFETHKNLSNHTLAAYINDTYKIDDNVNLKPPKGEPSLIPNTQFRIQLTSKPQIPLNPLSLKIKNSHQFQNSAPVGFPRLHNYEIHTKNSTNKEFVNKTLKHNIAPRHSTDKLQNPDKPTEILQADPAQHHNNKTLYSIESSISTEYRRDLSPGHTQIVIEKVHYPKEHFGLEFEDGLNTISKDVLLRINRAAEHASVLPSLLLEPAKENFTSEETPLSMNGPIVILKDSSAEAEDSVDRSTEEDNLIAESQYIRQNVYQQLPEDFKAYPPKEKSAVVEVQSQTDEAAESETIPTIPLYTPASELPIEELDEEDAKPRHTRITHTLDHFQEHAERSFHSGNSFHEAPSRKFLKNFNPSLSESGNSPMPKGGFHYEGNAENSVQQHGYQQQMAANTYPQSEQSQNLQNGYLTNSIPAASQHQYQVDQENALSTIDNSFNANIRHSIPKAILPDYQNDFQRPTAPNTIYSYRATTPSPNKQLFVTITPANGQQSHIQKYQTPHEYVSEAAASLRQSKITNKPLTADSYTFVEVQKSFNIHNKLIKERDGKVLDQQETTYYQPQYVQDLSVTEAPAPERSQDLPPYDRPTQYVSLANHPINVDDSYEADEAGEAVAASHDETQHLVAPQEFAPASPNGYIHQIEEQAVPYALPLQQTEPQTQHHTVPERVVEGKPVESVPQTHIIQHQEPEVFPLRDVVEKIIEGPVPVDKINDRPVEVRPPYPVAVERYIDRPYPVHEIVEKHIPMPYPVIEPVGVPVHIDRYIDRPYPVETIVEKPVPYPVEKVVEKIVTKHVPVEVQKVIEKPVEKIVEKIVHRPVAVPIRVPIGIPVTMHGHYALAQAHPYPQHHKSHIHLHSASQKNPNSIAWSGGPPYTPAAVLNLPEKVLQNYYARMLKKLHPKLTNAHKSAYTAASNLIASKPTTRPTVPLVKAAKPPFKILDIRFDLKPPPPSSASWNQGSRYVYNTLPLDLTSASAFSGPEQQSNADYLGRVPHDGDHEEYPTWRNGHSLKRSPDFGRNLHMEYGFKPPLVPSVEIDDQGVPLNSGKAKGDN